MTLCRLVSQIKLKEKYGGRLDYTMEKTTKDVVKSPKYRSPYEEIPDRMVM